jgi:hypothetical protein
VINLLFFYLYTHFDITLFCEERGYCPGVYYFSAFISKTVSGNGWDGTFFLDWTLAYLMVARDMFMTNSWLS